MNDDEERSKRSNAKASSMNTVNADDVERSKRSDAKASSRMNAMNADDVERSQRSNVKASSRMNGMNERRRRAFSTLECKSVVKNEWNE